MNQATADYTDFSDQADAGADDQMARESEVTSVDTHTSSQGAGGETTTAEKILSGDIPMDDSSLDAATQALLAEIDAGKYSQAQPDHEAGYSSESDSPEDDDSDEDVVPDHTPRKQMRLRPRSDLGEKVFSLMKADHSLKEEDAFVQAMEELGLTPKFARDPEAMPGDYREDEGEETSRDDTSDRDEFSSSTDVEARIELLREEGLKALEEEYDNVAFAQAQREIRRLEQVQLQLISYEQEKAAEWERASEASQRLVATKYPEVLKPDSTVARRMMDIDEAWADAGDDRYFDPRKPELIMGILEKELGLSAKQPAGASRTPAPRSTHPAASAMPISPARGGARTSSQTGSETFRQKLEGIKTTDDYERVSQELLGILSQ